MTIEERLSEAESLIEKIQDILDDSLAREMQLPGCTTAPQLRMTLRTALDNYLLNRYKETTRAH